MELSDRQKEIIAQAKRSGASAPSTTQQPAQTQAPEEDKGFIESIADRARMNLTNPDRLKSKLRVLGQGMSFGTTDEAEAFVRSALGGSDYKQELGKIRGEMSQFAKANPSTAITGEILGAVASPAGLIKAPAMLAKLGNLGQAAVRSGTGGAAYGFGTGEGGVEQRLEKAKEMGLTSAVIGGVAQKTVAPVVQALGQKVKSALNEPTSEGLRRVTKEAYDLADKQGFKVVPNKLSTLAEESSAAAKTGDLAYKPQIHTDAKRAFDFVEEMADEVPLDQMNLRTMEQIRTNLGQLARKSEGADTKIILDLRDDLDKLVSTSLNETGDDLYKAARQSWAQFKKAEMIEEAFEAAGLGASSSGTGGNLQNQMRQAVKSIINNKKKSAFFKKDEIKELKKFVSGSMDENFLRFFGRLAPTTGAAMALANAAILGASMGGSVPAQLAALGAKSMGDISKTAQARRLVESIGGLRPSMARPFQELLPNRAVMPAAIETGGLLGN
jgi:hypothetical protein